MMNIYEKMAEITAEINTVAKNLNVETGKGKGYKAVSEADVLAAVKPIEKKHGVYSYPYEREIVDSGELVNQTQYGERKSLFLRVRTVYRFVNTEKPDEYLDIVTYGDGVDSQDKAPGKAMTYGDKYALLKAYKIQTGDDPDQNASGELVSQNIRTQKIGTDKISAISTRANNMGLPLETILHQYRLASIGDMTEEQFYDCVQRLNAEEKKRGKK
jgi:hypothetical protein